MRGYDMDEYEDLDEYEDDEEREEEEGGEGEYEEEESHQPTQEELEYLELRQKLKESIRKKMKKGSGAANSSSRANRSTLPKDNYGSFFGPSQPVIAQRVIQESKSLLENPNLAERFMKSNSMKKKASGATPVGSKPGFNSHRPKVTNGLKAKAQVLKNARDYSFLLSDDAEVPAPAKNPPPRKLSTLNYETRSAQMPPSEKLSSSNIARKVPNGCDERKTMPGGERKPMSGGSQMQMKTGSQKLASVNKPSRPTEDSRKQLGSINGSGPGRPLATKVAASKVSAGVVEKKISAPVAKSSMPGTQRPPAQKLQSSVSRQSLVPKQEPQEPSKLKMLPKKLLPSTTPKIKQPLTQTSARRAFENERPKKRPVRHHEEDDAGEAISLIRKMFGYNPNKYRDDDDDSDMEANFDDIIREENRSARIARREDEEELRKIEEEERQERLRKAKKRKLSQH